MNLLDLRSKILNQVQEILMNVQDSNTLENVVFSNLKFTYILYMDSVRASQETHYVSAAKTNQLMLFMGKNRCLL
jgi:hypothetical protein